LNDLVQYFDLEKDTMTKGEKLGKDLVVKSTGPFQTETYQSFSTAEEGVRAVVKGLLGNEKNPTGVAKSIWVDHMGQSPKDLTKEDLKKIEDEYVNRVELYYDEIYKSERDDKGILAQKKYDEEKSKDKGKDKDTPNVTMNTMEGKPVIEDVKIDGAIGYDTVMGKSVSFGFDKPIKIGHSSEGIQITKLYLSETDSIAFEGKKYKLEEKGDNSLATVQQIVNGTQEFKEKVDNYSGGVTIADAIIINDIARAAGFNNATELTDYLKEQRDGKKDNQTKDSLGLGI